MKIFHPLYTKDWNGFLTKGKVMFLYNTIVNHGQVQDCLLVVQFVSADGRFLEAVWSDLQQYFEVDQSFRVP